MDSQHQLTDKEVRWNIRVKIVDVVYKVFISLIGAIVAAVFLWLQHRQTESRYYTELMSQRERADTDLRAEMFKVLFEAYFKNKIQMDEPDKVSRQSPDDRPADALQRTQRVLEGLRQEALLGDLLARNFDNIDVRPLLEDLDDRLAQQIGPRNDRAFIPPGTTTTQENEIPEEADATPTTGQRQAFMQREQLRRVAIGAVSRQIAALEGLADKARARVTYHTLNTCTPDSEREELTGLLSPALPNEVTQHGGGPIAIKRVRDGAINLSIMQLPPNTDKSDASEVKLSITFFDMPTLENIRLNNGDRVAFSLY